MIFRQTEKDRELLKRRIVRNKYFKEVEPNFLTYVEKDQIKKLHREDPGEWTPERLSESFPVLPHTIRKILKAKWEPKSVERILAYDNKVVKNWKQFKTGQLPVNPILEEHLMKFKDRKIILSNRETLAEKYMLPKIELPKPKSSFFRSIITDCVGKKSLENKILISSQDNVSMGEKKSEASKKNMRLVNKTSNDTTNGDKHSERYEIQNTKDKLITLQNDKSRINRKSNMSEKKERLVFETDNDFVNREVHETKRYSIEGDTLVFEEFLKKKLNNLDEIPYEEKATLVNTYKKYMETKKNLENLPNVSHNTVKDTDTEQKNVSSTKNPCDESKCIVNVTADENESVITKPENENVSLDTYLKERNSYMDADFNYTKHIKIPKNVYKKGMTYRVRDCYYDCDGEFLYRVPGLKT